MLKDITLGQYYPGDTLVHRLDPRTKLILTLIYIAALFTAIVYAGYALVVLFLAVSILLSRIRLRNILSGLKPLIIIVLITGLAFLLEMSIFGTFFERTGMSLDAILRGFSWAGWLVTVVCAVAVVVLLHVLLRHLAIYNKVKASSFSCHLSSFSKIFVVDEKKLHNILQVRRKCVPLHPLSH